MAFGRSKNRRHADAAEQRDATQGTATRILAVVGPVCLCAALTAGLFFGFQKAWAWAHVSPTFAVKTITFEGCKRANETDLLKLAALFPGQNVFAVDVGLTERAMAQHPWVKSVEVERHLPSGIAVKIQEHAPSAIASFGELYLVDADGEPFRKVQAGDDLDLPLITGITREAYVEQRESVEARFREALAVAKAYGALETSPRDRLSEVRLEPTELVLVTGKGQQVRLGEGEVDAKLARLQQVRGELTRRGLDAEIIHLDNRVRPGWVAVKLSNSGSERTGGR